MLQGQIYDVTGQRLERRVDELLERFGLADAADRAAKTYSGGMQRRLDIALGLLHSPRCSSSTSRRRASTPRRARRCGARSAVSRARSR